MKEKTTKQETCTNLQSSSMACVKLSIRSVTLILSGGLCPAVKRVHIGRDTDDDSKNIQLKVLANPRKHQLLLIIYFQRHSHCSNLISPRSNLLQS